MTSPILPVQKEDPAKARKLRRVIKRIFDRSAFTHSTVDEGTLYREVPVAPVSFLSEATS
jgi:hypothetical protein